MSSLPVRHPAPSFDVINIYFELIYDPTMHMVFVFDGEVDADALREATMRLIGSDPYLRSRFAEADELPVWEEIPEEEWGRAFVLIPAGEDEPLLTPPPPIDVRAGPQVRVALYRQPDGDLVAVTCHHGFCDAHGLTVLAGELFAAYRGITTDPDFSPVARGPYDRSAERILALYSAEERERSRAGEEPHVDRWQFPAERAGRGTPRIASRTLAPERLGRIKAFGREHGATVNDTVVAAYFLALTKVRGDPSDRGEPRSVLTSADLRRRHPVSCEDAPLTNLSIAYEVTLPAGVGAELEDVIGKVAAATRRRKAGNLGLATVLFYEEVVAGGIQALRAHFDEMLERYEQSGLKNPVFSNIAILDPGDYLPVPGKDGATLDLRDVRYLPCLSWPYTFLVIAATFRDRLTITTAYEEGPYSTATVERFLDYMDEYLP